jgi:hypothetical protein
MRRWGRIRCLLKFCRISLDPSEDGGVIHLHAAVQQHELEIAVDN